MTSDDAIALVVRLGTANTALDAALSEIAKRLMTDDLITEEIIFLRRRVEALIKELGREIK
jgi:hypothetical protein